MHFITLIADIEQLADLGVVITSRQREFLNKVWPGPVSVIFDQVSQGSPSSLAVRLPDYSELRELIKEVGPIISTSANRHGELCVTGVTQAKKIFGTEIDEYLDAGELSGEASTIVKVIR